MKKSFITVATLLLLVSCTKKGYLPEHPKDKEVYRDGNNSWVWNAAAGYWLLNHGNSSGVRYYPGTDSWRNSKGALISEPAHLKSVSYKPNSSAPLRSSGGVRSSSHFGSHFSTSVHS